MKNIFKSTFCIFACVLLFAKTYAFLPYEIGRKIDSTTTDDKASIERVLKEDEAILSRYFKLSQKYYDFPPLLFPSDEAKRMSKSTQYKLRNVNLSGCPKDFIFAHQRLIDKVCDFIQFRSCVTTTLFLNPVWWSNYLELRHKLEDAVHDFGVCAKKYGFDIKKSYL